MNYKLKHFVHLLTTALNDQLPGQPAQFLMAPQGREQEYPDLSKLTGYRTSAVCLMFFEKNDSIYLPIIERTEYNGTHSGQLALPGGKIDPSDKDAEECALRETMEEIGVEVSREKIIGRLSKLFIPPSNFMVHPILAWHPNTPTFTRNERELKCIYEMPLKNIFDKERNCQTKVKNSNGIEFQSPGIQLGNKIIWGATAMILSELSELIKSNNELLQISAETFSN